MGRPPTYNFGDRPTVTPKFWPTTGDLGSGQFYFDVGPMISCM